MSDLTRRTFLAGAATLPIVAAVPLHASAEPTLDDVVAAFVEHDPSWIYGRSMAMKMPSYRDGRGRERARFLREECRAADRVGGFEADFRRDWEIRVSWFREEVERDSTPSQYRALIEMVERYSQSDSPVTGRVA
ncbi:hypothetical protein ATO13_22146 [Stappia sp. 22II-S9-Z10]|nr:hypothetical protein ATO13_22146 [Stappia sp. 22II-S9-Z10]